RFTSLLIGLGLNTFSMSPSSLFPVKKALGNFKVKQAQTLAKKALSFPTSEQIKNYLTDTSHFTQL
ncbi:MAG TPA: hypothetical protein DDW93_05185, partial [Firmicutes bacterium]|nr:hypothetical protein [Bacillota bacterium]